jgi:hypothetical protein
MTKKQFYKIVRKLENAWERKYRREARKSDYETIEQFSDVGWTQKEFEQAGREKLQSQIDYITEMVSFQLWFGMAPVPSNLAKIRKFLDMQLTNPRKQNKPLYSITFHGGCSEHSVNVNVQRLGEVDFADSYDFLNFEIIQISEFGTKRWTEKSINGIIKEIKDDFAFDGFYPRIKVEGRMKVVVGKMVSLNLACRM